MASENGGQNGDGFGDKHENLGIKTPHNCNLGQTTKTRKAKQGKPFQTFANLN